MEIKIWLQFELYAWNLWSFKIHLNTLLSFVNLLCRKRLKFINNGQNGFLLHYDLNISRNFQKKFYNNISHKLELQQQYSTYLWYTEQTIHQCLNKVFLLHKSTQALTPHGHSISFRGTMTKRINLTFILFYVPIFQLCKMASKMFLSSKIKNSCKISWNF